MSMSKDLLEVQKDFLEGTKEIYENMMTEEIYIHLMSEEETKVNVYQEAPVKHYKEPIALWGKIQVTRSAGQTDVEKNTCNATITVPTKDLMDKEIDFRPQNYDVLKKAVISYQGVYYQIEEINPITNVANVFLFHTFICTEVKDDFLKGDNINVSD